METNQAALNNELNKLRKEVFALRLMNDPKIPQQLEETRTKCYLLENEVTCLKESLKVLTESREEVKEVMKDTEVLVEDLDKKLKESLMVNEKLKMKINRLEKEREDNTRYEKLQSDHMQETKTIETQRLEAFVEAARLGHELNLELEQKRKLKVRLEVEMYDNIMLVKEVKRSNAKISQLTSQIDAYADELKMVKTEKEFHEISQAPSEYNPLDDDDDDEKDNRDDDNLSNIDSEEDDDDFSVDAPRRKKKRSRKQNKKATKSKKTTKVEDTNEDGKKSKKMKINNNDGRDKSTKGGKYVKEDVDDEDEFLEELFNEERIQGANTRKERSSLVDLDVSAIDSPTSLNNSGFQEMGLVFERTKNDNNNSNAKQRRKSVIEDSLLVSEPSEIEDMLQIPSADDLHLDKENVRPAERNILAASKPSEKQKQEKVKAISTTARDLFSKFTEGSTNGFKIPKLKMNG